MKNNKYKILVLSDLKGSTNSTLKNTISLSQMIDAEINFFHVKKPTDIVDTDSQLSAMRTISKKHIIIEKKIQNLVTSFSKEYNVNINASFAFGNVKNQIKNAIKRIQPDIIVLGKRKQKALRLIGDSITEFVLDTHEGAVMIASDTHGLEPESELSLGFFNNTKQPLDLNFTDELIRQTEQSLKSFSIVDKTNNSKLEFVNTKNKTVDFVFDKNDNVFNTLSNYVQKNNVNLLCLNRGDNTQKQKGLNSEIKDVVKKVDVSLFLTNEKQFVAN